MPAASGSPIVGKMSSRVLNMKFMQRGSKNPQERKSENRDSTTEENSKAYVKDESEWSFKSKEKVQLLKMLKSKSLISNVSKAPASISQTLLNNRYSNNEISENENIGRKEFGKKDELDAKMEELDTKSDSEEPLKKNQEDIAFKEAKAPSKKRKANNTTEDMYKEKNNKKIRK